MVQQRFAFTVLTSVVDKIIFVVIAVYWLYMRIIHANFNHEFVRMLLAFTSLQSC